MHILTKYSSRSKIPSKKSRQAAIHGGKEEGKEGKENKQQDKQDKT
jgi:hypothetical protein